MKNRSLFTIAAACLFFLACSHKGKDEQRAEVTEDLINITQNQFETGNLAIGEPLKIRMEETVRCNGNIIVEPSGIARIGTLMPGMVRKIFCTTGEKVKAGQPLFELTGNEFIELQKDLAGTASHLKQVRSEYERMKSLFSEKVGSEKEFILAETEYKTANSEYSALKMKIKLLGLDELNIEEGNFYEYFLLKSPINGYISGINVSVGQYADQQVALAEIFDVTRLQLRIAVFEKDIDKLRENQKISFTLLGNTSIAYPATLRSVGKNVSEDSKSVMCYASIDDLNKTSFVNNAYVDAVIVTKSDSVTAVPEDAVVRYDGSNYLLEYIRYEDGIHFLKKVRVDIGNPVNGYAEILNPAGISRIITSGAYNIRIE